VRCGLHLLLVVQTGSESCLTLRRSALGVELTEIYGRSSGSAQADQRAECRRPQGCRSPQECRSQLLPSFAAAACRLAAGLGQHLLVVPFQQLLRPQLLPLQLQIQSEAAVEPRLLHPEVEGAAHKTDHLQREDDQSA